MSATTPNPQVNDRISLQLLNDWSIDFQSLSSHSHHHGETIVNPIDSSSSSSSSPSSASHQLEGILLASIPLSKLYAHDKDTCHAFTTLDDNNHSKNKGAVLKVVAVALADYAARSLSTILPHQSSRSTTTTTTNNNCQSLIIQTMGQAKHHHAAKIQEQKKRYSQRPNKKRNGKKDLELPYILERTDCMVIHPHSHQGGGQEEEEGGATLQFYLHGAFFTTAAVSDAKNGSISSQSTATMEYTLSGALCPILQQLTVELSSHKCFTHVAAVVLQRQLRSMLQQPLATSNTNTTNQNKNDSNGNNATTTTTTNDTHYLNAVAFIADGSLLPRKSGRSIQPMNSPPAVPFTSPEGSEQLTRVVTVEVGSFWRRFLNHDGSVVRMEEQRLEDDDSVVPMNTMGEEGSNNDNAESSAVATADVATTSVTMRGMIIPRGVTLIVGGGYHGKSTLLQALSVGVYDKLPGDGRERCVSHNDAVSIRAEDGRYVNKCNVSAFISNLPGMRKGKGKESGFLDTTQFSTKDASGSTSQAANVMEAVEAGASTLLVDEDVSAANFMARDGRMRAMIMDEPITPLLYRVNGLYLAKEHQVSTVVVVGGVGEWLDVADAVVLMKEYVAYDGLKKARSVSYQFSYGHVQYAGRGVVHRLPWGVKEDKSGGIDVNNGNGGGGGKPEEEEKQITLSPLRRRPASSCVLERFRDAAVHLLESGSSRLWFYRDDHGNNGEMSSNGEEQLDEDEDDGIVDMSKCSQLVGNASEQLYGCGICILWLLRASQHHPEEDLSELLNRMELALDNGGMNNLIMSLKEADTSMSKEGKHDLSTLLSSHAALDLWETVGHAYRPRRHEVAMALTRMRGMAFEILPDKPRVDEASLKEEEERMEEERKKKILADLWNNRRKKAR